LFVAFLPKYLFAFLLVRSLNVLIEELYGCLNDNSLRPHFPDWDTVGGATLDASFVAVKRYTGHVVSCLGWGNHSLAPLSFRGATYSGVFTLLPLIMGEGRAHHGKILAQIAALAEAGKLTPLLNERCFSTADINAAYTIVEAGSLEKLSSISKAKLARALTMV
jgi:hypothetical protein